MKRHCYISVYLVFCCALFWLGGCNEPAKVTTDVPGPAPKIEFEELGHDFGDVSPNKLIKGRIKFTNTGQGVLKITEIEQCCSVVAKLAGDKKEYAPGESGAIEVEFTTGSKAILFKRELVVHSNDKANRQVKLAVQAMIVLNVAWEPERLRLFLDEDNAACPKVTIKCLDQQPFAITGIRSTGDCITADFDPSAEATEFVLEPKVDVQKLTSNPQGSVMVILTHPDGNAAIVPFDVVPKYAVSPQVVLLLEPEPDKPIIRRISVLSNYNKDFEIESVSTKSDNIAVKVLEQKKIENGYQIAVEMTLKVTDGQGLFTDEFSVGIKGGETLTIPCRVWYSKRG